MAVKRLLGCVAVISSPVSCSHRYSMRFYKLITNTIQFACKFLTVLACKEFSYSLCSELVLVSKYMHFSTAKHCKLFVPNGIICRMKSNGIVFFSDELPVTRVYCCELFVCCSISDSSTVNEISSVTINQSAEWIALSSSEMGQLCVWEWQSQTHVLKQQSHFGSMSSLAYSPDAQYIVTGGLDGKVNSLTASVLHYLR